MKLLALKTCKCVRFVKTVNMTSIWSPKICRVTFVFSTNFIKLGKPIYILVLKKIKKRLIFHDGSNGAQYGDQKRL